MPNRSNIDPLLKAILFSSTFIVAMHYFFLPTAFAQCVATGATCIDQVDTIPLQARLPLILVHGWNSISVPAPPLTDTWNNFIAYFNQTPSLNNSFKLYCLSYNSNSVSVPQLGRAFRDILDQMNAVDPNNFGGKPMVIIAHSMGGLISRYLMTLKVSQGYFSGRTCGERVLKLLTLGTPHHGSMLANGPAMEAKAGVVWGSALETLNSLLYSVGGPAWYQPNRTDMFWDNYDGLLDYLTYPSERNVLLENINADSTYDDKIIAYAGSIAPDSSCGLDKYCWGSTVVGGVFALASDGVVPVTSAEFYSAYNSPRASTRYFSGYNHSDMASGKGDNLLFDRIRHDLAEIPITPQAQILKLWPVSGATPGGTATLWAEVKNTGSVTMPSDAAVWFYVDGLSWSGSHWVGSTSIASLGGGSSQWYSFSWIIPSGTASGSYTYWAQAYITSGAISDLSAGQTFTVSGVPGAATLLAPSGSISVNTPTYRWNAVPTATWYWLWVDDSTGNKISTWYTASQAGCATGTGNCSVTPSTTLAAGNCTWWVEGYNSYGYGPWSDGMAFTVFTATEVPATMTSPADGSTLSGFSVTFKWSTGTGVSAYWLYVGTAIGQNDIYGQSQGTSTSKMVSGLPTDGRRLYVRLWSKIGSNWPYRDYSYTASRETDVWIRHGPEGGWITALAIDHTDSTILFTGTGSGVYMSNNAGVNWTYVDIGSTCAVIYALKLDPSNPAVIYVGANNGIFKSTDNGLHWQSSNTGLSDSYIYSMAIDPMTPTTLYVGTSTGGIFRSADGGAHWSAANAGLPTNLTVRSLAIDPVHPATVYAGVDATGVYKSTDSGVHWSAFSMGLPNSITYIYDLVVDPKNPNTLYAGLYEFGAYKSIDGGAHWSAVNTGLTDFYVHALVLDPRDSAALYAATRNGIFKSVNGGGVWGAFNTSLRDTEVLIIDPSNPNTFYAVASKDLCKSTDNGASWNAIHTGLIASVVYSLAIDPTHPATVFAGTWGMGVFKSADGGNLWKAANAGFAGTTVNSLAIDPVSPTVIFAGTDAGVFKSTDGGDHWNAVNKGLTDTYVEALTLDPATPTTIYAGTFFGGVFKSNDGGASWQPSSYGLTYTGPIALAVDPIRPTILYAGSHHLFKSTDGGANWHIIGTGLPSVGVNVIAIDPKNSSILYVCTDGGGVFKSEDGGVNWVNVQHDNYTYALAIDPVTPTTLYVGTCSGGVLKSTDGGMTWINLSYQSMTNPRLKALAIDPITPTIVYAGTFGGAFVIHQ